MKLLGLKAGFGPQRAVVFAAALAVAAIATVPPVCAGQTSTAVQIAPAQVTSSDYQGSVTTGKVVPGVLPLSLHEAITRGLQHNLGLILTSQNTQSARGTVLQQLQALLPGVDANATEAVQQTDLQAQGLRVPGFPATVGPYGYTDLRGSVSWSLLNLPALQNYLAAKHDFAASKLSLADARNLVVLTVGNAYLTTLADKSRATEAQAQLAAAKVSLDQAVASHAAGTVPQLDELRARVDYQSQQQSLISAQNAYAQDRIALARAIGLPLDQKFTLTTAEPYAPLDHLTADAAVAQALATRPDLKALEQRVIAAEHARKAATDERLPTIGFKGDYGDMGVNPAHSHGTGSATGTLDMPIFEEAKLRGDAKAAQAQLDSLRAQLSDLKGQISADVRDSILDIHSSEKQVQVAQSNKQLAGEALTEAQERFKAGVSDNLAVSQALAALAQADTQYVDSLYQLNVAKLSLARALGVAGNDYQQYLGGK